MCLRRLYLIVLTSIGIVIHTLCLCGVICIGNNPLWAHMCMFIIDYSVVLGLIFKCQLGYWLALPLYLQQTIFQISWFMYNPILFFVPLSCFIALIILLFSRKTLCPRRKKTDQK